MSSLTPSFSHDFSYASLSFDKSTHHELLIFFLSFIHSPPHTSSFPNPFHLAASKKRFNFWQYRELFTYIALLEISCRFLIFFVYAFVYVDFFLRRLVPFSLVYIHLIHLPSTLFIFSSHHLMHCFTSSVFSLADPIHRFYLLRFTCIPYNMTNFSPHLSRLSLCSSI